MNDTPPIAAAALEALRQHADRPGPRVERVVESGETYWIKRPGETQANGWHRLQGLLAAFAPHPMLRVTVDRGGPASTAREAGRIREVRAQGFLAPPVIFQTHGALVLGDIGETLGTLFERDRAAFEALLPPVGDALGRLHAAGLVHGRPSRRDLTAGTAGTIGFLDFEEQPERAMPLAVAQARDLWLLFIDLARAGTPRPALRAAFAAYRPHLSAERRSALAPTVRFAAGAARVLRPLTAPIAGRDLKAPMEAARFLRAALRDTG